MTRTSLPLVVVYPDGRIQELTSYTLDLAYGLEENDFELATATVLPAGAMVFMDGTSYGGIIDRVERSTEKNTTTYRGRTWWGILATRIIEPPPGQAYLTVSGDANQILAALLEECGLPTLFTIPHEPSQVRVGSFQFDRYVTLLEGLMKLTAKTSAKLITRIREGELWAWIERAGDIQLASEHTHFTSLHDAHPVNHLIGLGKGELTDRQIVHRYADRQGRVTTQQYFYGVDEVQATYEVSNAEGSELEGKVEDKLREILASADAVDFDVIGDASGFDVGDIVTATDAVSGMKARAPIVKKILKVTPSGVLTVSVDVGEGKSAQSSQSATWAGASSTSGVYVAGRGIQITGATISAEVAASDLDGLKGERGDPGPAGPAGTVTVGTVTTVEAGTPARVENVGTPSAAILNFTLPRGEKGEAGDIDVAPEVIFTASHPVGCLYHSTRPVNPSTFAPSTLWVERDCLDGYLYERTR